MTKVIIFVLKSNIMVCKNNGLLSIEIMVVGLTKGKNFDFTISTILYSILL